MWLRASCVTPSSSKMAENAKSVLFQHNQSKQVLKLTKDISNVIDLVKKAFGIDEYENKDIILQKFNDEWNEWIDTKEEEIQNMDKIMVHVKRKTTQPHDEPKVKELENGSYAKTVLKDVHVCSTKRQVSVGVVKSPGVLHGKTASQHLADLYCLKQKAELDICFEEKNIDCIRVDGGCDEGPGNSEVQFRWTEWHLKEERELTLVTTRNNGASCFNLAELQNGIIGRAHANLFIPSTLCGSSAAENGKVSQEKLKDNMEAALKVYLERVNNIPFGSSIIRMYRGATDTYAKELKDQRDDLVIFLRGRESDKLELRKRKPEQYNYFEKIWKLRKTHLVANTPSCYVFALRACYKENCIHPVCKRGQPTNVSRWFHGGPTIDYLPFPVPDPRRPWGSKDCDKCGSICKGHYLDTIDRLHYNARSSATSPPSVVIKRAFDKKTRPKECIPFTTEEKEQLAKDTLLHVHEVEMWLEHLKEVRHHRQEGAKKAVETKKKKKDSVKNSKTVTTDSWCICTCGGPESDGDMLACDNPTCPIEWYHFQCVGVATAPRGKWFCNFCT